MLFRIPYTFPRKTLALIWGQNFYRHMLLSITGLLPSIILPQIKIVFLCKIVWQFHTIVWY